MSGRTLRSLGLGLVSAGGAGLLLLTTVGHAALAYGDPVADAAAVDPNIGLVMGGSDLPIPGPQYVGAADELYLNNPFTHLYPDLAFYQATPDNPFGNGLFTPEGAYPLFSGGVHQLYFNYPQDANGLPGPTTSVGQGATILESTIQGNIAAGDPSTVFGYSQSSTLSGITMQLLEQSGVTASSPDAPQFLLIADPSNPNGGLFERFNGYETVNGDTHTLPLTLPSFGTEFDGATPSNDFVTNVYTLEYDGFADFPRYPLNFLSDLNAFLGIATLHGTYLNGGIGGSGPTAEQIANALVLPGSASLGTPDSLTNYHMILETAPLVSLLPRSLQELLGPDLTYLINLGYGDGTLGYSDTPANIATPFGLSSGVSASTMFNTLVTDTEQGVQNLMTNTDPYAASVTASASAGADAATAVSAAAPTLTEIVNALSSAASTAYSTLLPLTDIGNYLLTTVPVYELSLFTNNLATGDFTDAFGLPFAANTAIDTLSAGFAYEIISTAASQIAADFSSIGF